MRLGYQLDGGAGASVLVLSPSLGTTTSVWDAQVPAFAERFRLLRHDHPGHGVSPPPDGAVTVAGIGAGILDLLDELGVEQASFCGTSLGGMVGMWLGANAPERIDRLVLCCTGAALGTPETYRERAALVRAKGTRVTVEGARERWFTPAFRASPVARRLLAELECIPREGYAACCEAVGSFDFHGELTSVAAPALVVYGEDDPVVAPEVVETLVNGIPVAERAAIARAAHLANVEQPDAFNAAVLAYFDERVIA